MITRSDKYKKKEEDELAFYYELPKGKVYVEPTTDAEGYNLPRTGGGYAARAKALKDGRLITNKEARLTGKAPLMVSEEKRAAGFAKLAEQYGYVKKK